MEGIMYGYCHCGCGQRTRLAQQTDKRFSWVKGEPLRFINGHRTGNGKDNPNWKGGRKICKRKNTNYAMIKISDHLRSNAEGYVFEHIVVVEKTLGFSIGRDAVIHHREKNMNSLEVLSKIKATCISNLPDIKGMERLVITIVCSVNTIMASIGAIIDEYCSMTASMY